MVPPFCFIPGAPSGAVLPGSILKSSVLCSHNPQIKGARKRSSAPRIFAAQDPASPDHFLAPAKGDSGADRPPSPGSEADRKVLNDLTSSGKSSLQDIGDTVKDELEGVSDKTREFAENVIEEETAALLARYDEKQRELLANVDEERRVIEGELTRINKLADSVRKGRLREGPLSLRQKLLAAVAGLFSTAALIYAFTAVTDGNSGSFANAGINALVAAAAAFFFSRENSGGKDSQGNDMDGE